MTDTSGNRIFFTSVLSFPDQMPNFSMQLSTCENAHASIFTLDSTFM